MKVIVVGAGVIGTSVGYHLAREGVEVVVVEQESVGAGASVCAMGGLLLLSHELELGPAFDLGVAARRSLIEGHQRLEDESGIDILWAARPHLALAFDDEENTWLISKSQELSHAVQSEWLTAEEVLQLEPRINPAVIGGCLTDVAPQVDGYRLTLAYTAAMERLGGHVITGQVEGLIHRHGSVHGVRMAQRELEGDVVVIAAGPWSRAAGAWINREIPVDPVKGERLVLTYDGNPLGYHLSSPRLGVIFFQGDGRWSVGARGGRAFDSDAAHNIWDAAPSHDALNEMVSWATTMMPCLENASLAEHVGGIRPVSRDKVPIIGWVPGDSRVYVATGHGHSGIGLSMVTGELVSGEILAGRPLGLLDAFNLSRFGS